MKKLLIVFVSLWALCGLSFAEWNGSPPGFGGKLKVVASATYVGPGDKVSGAVSFTALRAYTAAYATSLGKIANICTPLDAVCADVNSDSSGNFNLSGIGTLVCNNIGSICTIKTLYDQSGAGACSGPCDKTNATIALRPVLVTGCIGSLVCMKFVGASTQVLTSPAPLPDQPEPFSVSAVVQHNGAFATAGAYFGNVSTQPLVAFIAVNTVSMYNGISLNATAIDSVFHAIQSVFNDAVSDCYIDGVSNPGTVSSGGGAAMSGGFTMGKDTFSNYATTLQMEEIIYLRALSGPEKSDLNTNQHSYWGF